MHVRSSRRLGFTILELMAVIIIIGLLSAIVVGAYTAHVRSARIASAKAQIRILADAVDTFHMANGRYPATLKALVTKPSYAKNWPTGGYLRGGKTPRDPWGNAYKLVIPGTGGEYDIVCYGADSAPGGTDDDADITNHGASEE